jgi:hypothetical protein
LVIFSILWAKLVEFHTINQKFPNFSNFFFVTKQWKLSKEKKYL